MIEFSFVAHSLLENFLYQAELNKARKAYDDDRLLEIQCEQVMDSLNVLCGVVHSEGASLQFRKTDELTCVIVSKGVEKWICVKVTQ